MKKALLMGAALGLAPAVALGADLPVASPAPAPVMVTYNQWAGFYGGLSIGWASGGSRDALYLPQAGSGQAGFVDSAYRSPAFVAAQDRYNLASSGCAAIVSCVATDSNFAVPLLGFNERSQNRNGGVFTINAGYNWQFGSWVVGVEADMGFMDRRSERSFSGSSSSDYQFDIPQQVSGGEFPSVTQQAARIAGLYNAEGTLNSRTSMNWLSTARLRAGYAAGPFLLFATGGLAGGSVSASASGTFTDSFTETRRVGGATGTTPVIPAVLGAPQTLYTARSTTEWRASGGNSTELGWTIGGGVEWQASAGFSLKAEYLYYDLGSSTLAVAGTTTTTTRNLDSLAVTTTTAAAPFRIRQDLNGHIFRVGFNFGFSAAPRAAAPVVAAY